MIMMIERKTKMKF